MTRDWTVRQLGSKGWWHPPLCPCGSLKGWEKTLEAPLDPLKGWEGSWQLEHKPANGSYTPRRSLCAVKWKGAPRSTLRGNPQQITLIICVGITVTMHTFGRKWDHLLPEKSSSLPPMCNQLLKKICPSYFLFSIPSFRRFKPRRGSRSRYHWTIPSHPPLITTCTYIPSKGLEGKGLVGG